MRRLRQTAPRHVARPCVAADALTDAAARAVLRPPRLGRPFLLLSKRSCTAIVPIPAPTCAKRMPATATRLSGWCHRIRDHGGVLFIDLRDHYGMTQCVVDPDSPAFGRAEKLRSEWVVRIDGAVRQPPGGHREPRNADRPDRGLCDRDRGSGTRRRTAHAGLRRAQLSRGHAAALSLPRSAPRQAAQEHHVARTNHRFDPRADEGAGLLRVPDADPHRVEPGRRARFSGAVPPASGKILRAAAGAAAVQAARHGRRASTAISRSRPAFATRTRGPTAAPANSISSISR